MSTSTPHRSNQTCLSLSFFRTPVNPPGGGRARSPNAVSSSLVGPPPARALLDEIDAGHITAHPAGF